MKVVLVLVLALAPSCTALHGDDATGGSATTAQPTPIASSERHAEAQEEVGYVGVLTPRETAEVSSPFTTRVLSISAKLGDVVKKGDVIGKLDDRPIREQLAIEKASLKSHQAQVASASVEHGAAVARLRREQKGLKENVSSQADVAAAGFDSSKAGTQVSRAMAEVEEQKARIEAMEKKLDDMTIVAPIDGKVSLRYVEDGARVVEGQPVIRVISAGELFVKFAIPASDAKKIAPGDAIDVRFETANSQASGVVRNIAPELDPIAQMIVAEATLDSPPADLQSGLVARITPRGKPAANGKK